MNILKRILFTVACLFSVAFFPLRVHAEFMPPTLPDLNTLNVPGFLMDVYSTQMLQEQGVLLSPSDVDTLNQICNGRSVSNSMTNHYVDNASIDAPLQTFYDSNGNIVAQADSYTVLGSSDLCNYSFVCDKSTGEILMSYDEYHGYLSTLEAGNLRYSSLYPNSNNVQQQSIRDTVNRAVEENMIVFANTLTEENKETLAQYDYYMTYSTNAFGYTVYVPNACSSNTVVQVANCPFYEFSGTVPYGDNNVGYGWSPIIRTNDPSEVYYSAEGRNNYVQLENNNAYGYQFSYISNVNVGSLPFYAGGYMDFHIPTQSEYQNFRQLSDGSVYLQPAENSGEVTNEFNYTIYNNNITKPSPIINHNYDNRTETNYNNYPVTNNVSYPDYSTTTNTYTTNIYNYYTKPKVEEELEANPELIDNDIPILSNLQNRFPFSIPWDIANMLKTLEAQREAPVIEGSIYFPVINYTWVCSIDLSMFDDSATLFRKLFLILFIVGLAVFSYAHHFGS